MGFCQSPVISYQDVCVDANLDCQTPNLKEVFDGCNTCLCADDNSYGAACSPAECPIFSGTASEIVDNCKKLVKRKFRDQ